MSDSGRAIRVLNAIFVLYFFFKVTMVVSSPWYNAASSLSSKVERYTSVSSVVSFSAPIVIVSALIILFYFFSAKMSELKLPQMPSILLAALLLVRMISLLVAGTAGLQEFILYFVSFAMILIAAQIERNDYSKYVTSIAKTIVVVSIACALIAVVQCAFVASGAISFRQYRINGFLFDAVIAGLFYSLGLICLVFLMNKGVLSRLISILFAVLLTIGGLLTGSRSFFYFFAVAVLYYAISTKGIKSIVVILPICILALVVLPGLISSSGLASMTTDEFRDAKANLALELFCQQPIFGIGTDQFPFYDLIMGSGRGTNPHNIYLQVLCENGIIGFIILILLVVSLLVAILKKGIAGNSCFSVMMILLFAICSAIIGTIGNYLTLTLWILLIRAIELTASSCDAGGTAMEVPDRFGLGD